MTACEVRRRSVMGKREQAPISKKCRICFQTETIPISSTQKEQRPIRGKTCASENGTGWNFLGYLGWKGQRKGEDEVLCKKQYEFDTNDDGFISPCRCRGSMAWVHRECLRVWRSKSPRSDSFYQCEQCFTPYMFRHTWTATILSHPLSLKLLTAMALGGSLAATMFLTTLFLPTCVSFTGPNNPFTSPSTQVGGKPLEAHIYEPTRTTNIEMQEAVDGVDQEGQGSRFVNIIRNTGNPNMSTYTGHRAPVRSVGTTHHRRYYDQSKHYQQRPPPITTSPSPSACGKSLESSNASGSKKRRRLSLASEHSPISYFNIGYWMTGHSIDEAEDARNDFFDAVLSVIFEPLVSELLPSSLSMLACLALIREGTPLACLFAVVLIFATLSLYMLDWSWTIWVYPLPMIYGLVRFIRYLYRWVEHSVDFFIKWSSSDLIDYQG